ncbi:uncharacterized protein LOC136084988 [Hydra vulgaris]|uniref:Uncharacterized protein LOC136084988 n=1 Tax=Hydra vulgaris TaxID=6087 RepID=A0ABM4CKZ2_HYDVU
MAVTFGIIIIAYFVQLTLPLPIESQIECVNKDEFKTLDGSYLHCKLSCPCQNDDQKEVHISYVGCQKCCCGNIDCKRIEKALQENNKTLEYTLQENQNLTDNNANLKKISEEKAIALYESNKKNKVFAFIIAILVLFIAAIIIINRWNNVRSISPSNVTTDSQGLIDSKEISVEKLTSSKHEIFV